MFGVFAVGGMHEGGVEFGLPGFLQDRFVFFEDFGEFCGRAFSSNGAAVFFIESLSAFQLCIKGFINVWVIDALEEVGEVPAGEGSRGWSVRVRGERFWHRGHF